MRRDMMKFSKYKKGNIIIIIPVFLVALTIITGVIFRLTIMNTSKVYLYPYKYSYYDKLQDSDVEILNTFLSKIDMINIKTTEELREYLYLNNPSETDQYNRIYYHRGSDTIKFERKVNGDKIQNTLNYKVEEERILLELTKYYEGV